MRVRISKDSFFFFFFLPGGEMDARRHTRGRIAPLLNQVLSEKTNPYRQEYETIKIDNLHSVVLEELLELPLSGRIG